MDLNKALELIYSKLIRWMNELIRLLPNIALAALIIVLGFLASKWVRNFARRLSHRFSHNQTLTDLFASFIYLFGIGVTIFIALNVLRLDTAVTSVLAGAGIVGIALAFAFQDVAANFMSGIFLTLRKPFRVGDIVSIKDYMGKISKVNLRDTVIQTFRGQTVIIPNKEVFQNPIENYSYLGKRRMDLTVGVSYGDDLDKVRNVVLQAVKGIPRILEDETTLFFNEFGDSSINFSLRLWLNTPDQIPYLQAQSDAIVRIKNAFDANDIVIPFPIRTLDFGIKGGATLSEMELSHRSTNGSSAADGNR